MRLVLDTNVVVSAVLGSGAPSRLIELATEGAIDLFSSNELISELACALAIGADLIVSGDPDLLNLKSFHRIPIITPAAAFAQIEQRK